MREPNIRAKTVKPDTYQPLLSKRRRWFDGEDNEDDPKTPAPSDKSAPDTAPDNNSGDADKTFTQSEANAIMAKEYRRGQDKAQRDLLADLGFDDVEAVKKLVTDAKARAEAEKTDLEKAQDQIDTLTAEIKAAADKLTDSERQRQAERRDAAVLVALNGAEFPQDVLTWIRSNKADDLAAVTNDEGDILTDAVSKLVEGVKKERPKFFKSGGPGSPSLGGGRTPQVDEKEIMKLARKTRL